MPIFGEKPFTSITVKVNQLCTANRNSDLEDESIELYVEDLISLIKLQSSGAIECARAVRKKIKYGNTPQESVLALNLLELLVLNAGSKIGQTIASDDKLTDLLKTIVAGQGRSGLGGPYDGLVVRRIRELAYGWKTEFDGLNGYSNLANLYKSAPQSRHRKQSSRQVTPPEDDQENDEFRDPVRFSSRNQGASSARSPPPRPSAMSPYADPPRVDRPSKSKSKSKKSKKSGKVYADAQYKIPQINYKVEAPKIRTTIAECHTHTTALDNSLLALPKGKNPMDDTKASTEFEKCRKIRHKVLRYLQFVGAGDNDHKTIEIIALDEEFLGSLIVANEQLVTSFKRFDELCGYTTENPAEYHQEDRNNDPISSDESYYSSDSEEEEEEELSGRMNDLHVRQASSRLESVTGSESAYESTSAAAHREVPAPRKAAPRPPQVKRQESIISTESGDPFGDGNEVSREKSLYY